MATTPGTAAPYWVKNDLMDWNIEITVTLGPRHQNDHVTIDKIACVFKLRHPTKDQSFTVKLSKRNSSDPYNALQKSGFLVGPKRFNKTTLAYFKAVLRC